MNYLAHLFLSEPSDERRIGSILADFTVGTIDALQKKYGAQIATGIKHHREVDRYTDSHPAVVNSTGALGSGYGPYSGIIVDVVFDHFLLKNWDRFSAVKENDFFNSVYSSLNRWDWEFPSRYQQVIGHMVEKQWLDTYRELPNVAYALKRIGERFPRKTPLDNALVGIRENYSTLEKDFLAFFPSLVKFSGTVDCRV